nr:hypothetical protein [Tanacetum cinerariifolium]
MANLAQLARDAKSNQLKDMLNVIAELEKMQGNILAFETVQFLKDVNSDDISKVRTLYSLKEIDLETAQNNVVAKFPLLKHGDYEIWKLRIEQYFQVQDYALWDVIENGNFFKLVSRTTANADGTSISTVPCPVTTKEKALKNNDVKSRCMLLMALPNEYLLTFSQYKEANTLFEAIQARFGGNDATKKTQKTLMKQMYENFNAPSIENKADLDTMSIDDLYNNFKIIKQEVKRTVTTSSCSGSQNMAFLSSPASTNEVDDANIQVSIVSTPVSTVSTHDNTANLNDATVYAFLANQPNRYFQRTGKNITINGSDIAGYDKTKIECFNCHKMGHFATKCRSLKNQESMPRNQDSSRKTVNVEDTSSKATVAIDGAVLTKSRIVPISTARQSSSRAATPVTVARPINTAAPKALENRVTSAVGKQGINAAKSLACWVWRPKIKVQDHVSKNSRSYICKRFDYVDPEGRLKHMIGNISYLTDFKEHDGGYVAFGGGAKGGKITGKGIIRTADESHVLLKVPRKNNMYSFDMKNIISQKDLTCLLTKATNDESMLLHKRLGHINFKNITKLVKDNLVRGLPSKRFKEYVILHTHEIRRRRYTRKY